MHFVRAQSHQSLKSHADVCSSLYSSLYNGQCMQILHGKSQYQTKQHPEEFSPAFTLISVGQIRKTVSIFVAIFFPIRETAFSTFLSFQCSWRLISFNLSWIKILFFCNHLGVSGLTQIVLLLILHKQILSPIFTSYGFYSLIAVWEITEKFYLKEFRQ